MRPAKRPAKPSKTVKVRILDKEVQIGCAAGEEEDLSTAAHYVDTSMRELRGRNITSTTEKVAILTAINIANEMMKLKSNDTSQATMQTTVQQKIDEMQSQLDAALGDA